MSFKIRPLSSSIRAVNITVNRQPVEGSFHASGQPVICDNTSRQADGDLSFEIESCPMDGAPKLSLRSSDRSEGYRFFQEVFEKRIKQWAVNFQFNRPPAPFSHLKTYNELWAISEYTRRWIRRY